MATNTQTSVITKTRAQQVLYESEAALRLVHNELQELHDVDIVGAEFNSACDCVASFARATEGMTSVLARLRDGRAQIVGNRDQTALQLAFAVSLLDELEIGLTDVARQHVSARH